jgi:hypothetical protein
MPRLPLCRRTWPLVKFGRPEQTDSGSVLPVAFCLVKLCIGGTSLREPLVYSTSFSKHHFGGAQTVGQLLPRLLLILPRDLPCTAACFGT